MYRAHALKQYRTVRTGPCGAIPRPFHSGILFLFALLIFISAFIFQVLSTFSGKKFKWVRARRTTFSM